MEKFMLNFRKKRVWNPNLMVKFVVLSILVGVFTMVASFPVHASFAELLDEISENDPLNEEQISLEKELAILTGKDNHSEYLPNDSEEDEEDNCDQARLSISESTAEVDIPINDEEYKIYKAYMDGMSEGEEHKRFMDRYEDKDAPTTRQEYKKQIANISFWANPALKIRTYEKNHSEEETKAYSAALKNSAQEHMFEQIEEKRQQAWRLNSYLTPIVLQSVPRDDQIPKFEVELFENERNEQSDNQNNKQHNEQSNKQQSKRGDLCPGLFSKCNLI